jgi:hypothetical protein
MSKKRQALELAFLRKYPDESRDKAERFRNRVYQSPHLIFHICEWTARLMGRNDLLDSLVLKIPGLSLFFKFLLGNMSLVANSPLSTQPQSSQVFSSPEYDFTGEVFDLIVIGSGPGGAIAALRAAENGKKVLILEAGSSYVPSSIQHHSLDQTELQFKNSGLSFIYGLTPVIYAEGRTLGGGSEVNSGLYHRLEGQHRVDVLKSLEVSDSEWTDLELLVESELSVQTNPKSIEPNHGLILGARQSNLITREIPRWRIYEPEEQHQGMQQTYLKKALDKGVSFKTGEKVIRLNRTDYLEVFSAKDHLSIKKYRSRELVLSCGTIETPSLLNSSGFLDRNLPLNFHPMIRAVASQDMSINEGDLFPSWQAWTKDLKYKYGYSVSTYPYLSATLKSFGELEEFSVESLSTMAAYFASFALEDSRARLTRFRNRLVPNIVWGKKDRESIDHVSETLRQVLERGKASRVWPQVGRSAVTTVHLFGSLPIHGCSLIDNRGRLLREPRIRISDGSLFPRAPWGNPQGPIMVMCELMSKRNNG